MKGSFNAWLLEYFRLKGTGKDSSAVTELFCDASRKDELKDVLSQQFKEIMAKNDFPERDLDHILYKIHYTINSTDVRSGDKRKSTFLRWTYRVASVIILFVLVFWGASGHRNSRNIGDAIAEIHAPAWTRTKFLLPDGSSGWLNSNSTLRYKLNFNRERNVELTGEAYFDIKSDKKIPFIVNTGEVSVKVYGTTFNIVSWNEEDIEIVLGAGQVEVKAENSDSSFMLKPDELVLYKRSEKSFTVEAVESTKYLSWTEGKLVFRNDPMEVIEKRLERWYNVDVEVHGFFEDGFRLRATFVDDSLEEVLDVLHKSFNIGYSIEAKGVNEEGMYGKRKVKIFNKN